ncbi:MAG TPA: twin-arginine translocase TatA/TatE family subunit [Candidatus Limnocylindrales bacterium]
MTDVMLVLLIVLGAVLILRGPKTLPKLGEALGRGVKEARREAREVSGKPGNASQDTPDEEPPG